MQAEALVVRSYQELEAATSRVRGRIVVFTDVTDHRRTEKSLAEQSRALADTRHALAQTKAQADAQTIRGEGDSTAAAISAAAYSKNPEFYSFYRSLQAYRTSFSRDRDMLVLSPDSDFFRYMKSSAPARR